MIDTDKYQGHTDGGWYVDDAPDVIHPTVIHANDPNWDNPLVAELVMANAEEWTEEDYANARLIADAPLILEAFVDEQAEVMRLRKQLVAHTDFVLWVEEKHNEVFDEYERKDEL